ncbi:hypothetical protein [Streptococcus loxodontisalivarius]|uniref:Phosphate starvation-inducible membrane PsiE n=1 Tax=Streptococcus loxodontisalivarius TaxID=1349415 RepID=A0ABS2PS49_9STRE|nr:hypothetical protein [Streptococcus loxodontisalivarius]MBM7642868.1 phosphate starvation-inducible membrane PsiE [Streptococcus loxodontisalivarius]
MRKFLQTILYELSFYIEIIISLILSVVLFLLTVRLVAEATHVFSNSLSVENFLQEFLNEAMSLAIGVELIKMLTKHTSTTIIEVLLFAIARQIVVAHDSALNSLISVFALVLLFAARKYLLISFDDTSRITLRGSQKVKMANVLARMKLTSEPDELLRDWMVRKILKEGKTVTIGTTIYDKDVALRIESMKDATITRVEVIKSIN